MSDYAIEKYQFETGVYRPPSEGGSASLLLRFTRNCPWNHCAFCSMYKGEKFQLRSLDELKGDMDAMAALADDLRKISMDLGQGGEITRDAAMGLMDKVPELNRHNGFAMFFHWLCAGGRTAFIQDGNSIIMKPENLMAALKYLRNRFPSIERVTTYARSRTLAQRSLEDLTAIRRAGLDRLHLGLETGDDELLAKIKKGVTAQGHIDGGKKAMAAGFQVSEYWMPGLGGRELTTGHALNTARVLSAINPDYIRSRPFRAIPGTAMHTWIKKGQMHILTPHEQLRELKEMITALDVTSRVCFDHAGNNWLNASGRLLLSHGYEGYQFPDEKAKLLGLIDEGLKSHHVAPDITYL
ncbi:Radical SAM superfamily protein [Desulfocicer vacuolatum DSM 3385]|uniref:Radical SAM superfamily protein n=1 Tax=Desulfocicer vacuolatum DSM 3385 TaxID=1121400 RepID=A0A1W2BRF0_9BACT|nr:radical SAM protein [Desulfocicer vacuolatum]SMC75326.1 Radical SAM superfamily protein [Desulfocicer vacuolatum DSM 3385]